MADEQGILITGEILEGQLSQSTKELLAHGRGLANTLGEELAVGLLGDDVAETVHRMAAGGDSGVFAVIHDRPNRVLVCALEVSDVSIVVDVYLEVPHHKIGHVPTKKTAIHLDTCPNLTLSAH